MDEPTTDSFLKRTFLGKRELLISHEVEEADLTSRVLTTLNTFRLLIAGGFLALFFVADDPHFFGERYPTLFIVTAGSYLLVGLLAAAAQRGRWAPIATQGAVQLLADIVAVTLLMHASGGLSSGIGGLLIVFIGAGSLVVAPQYPAILAALATFAILGEHLLTQLTLPGFMANYPAAGILSGVIFAMTLAAQPLARRVQASEALARQFGVDLKNLSDLNRYIVQHLRESIVVLDADDTIRLINSSATRMLGTAGSGRGMTLLQASTPLGDYIRRWRHDPDMSSHPELTIVTRGDSLRVAAHLAPLGKDGTRSGPLLMFLEDVSLIKERVQQSKLASLGRLSASIAHEIRNPVGAMSHAAQLLAESPALDDDDRRLTEIIQTHSGRVSHIIDNVLQLSRRESSRPESLLIRPWLEDFAEEFASTHELQEGEFAIGDIPPDLEVRMDRSHLRQVMWNLCDNAVKYASEAGAIHVEVDGGRMSGKGRPYIEVLDSGHGVDRAAAEKIFEPFFTARSGGTGLGLYISRELCELNRATLLYLDRPGGGSIFRIVFSDPGRWDRQDDS